MIRLAHALLGSTQLPVHVQVMDPPASWLRAKGVDAESTREVHDKFAAVMGRARSCAAGSWAMAERYCDQFGIRCVPVLPSLPASLARPAAQRLGEVGAIRIGFAGQIYARQEWDTLLTCLDSLQWRMGEREIELHAFPHQKPEVLDRHTNRIHFHPWLPTSDLIDALSACDLTYCAYWFDEGFREDAELCFPAKISTYLAAGRPILFHGPAYASPSRFLAEWKAGFVCNSPGPVELAAVLRRSLTDRPLYATAARNGRLAFNQCLTRDQLAHSVREFLDLAVTQSHAIGNS
jgi:glycosyltransferase involved in cell wall biosynthesis